MLVFSWMIRNYCTAIRQQSCFQEIDKTAAMAPLGFLNEDVETAVSTKAVLFEKLLADNHSMQVFSHFRKTTSYNLHM